MKVKHFAYMNMFTTLGGLVITWGGTLGLWPLVLLIFPAGSWYFLATSQYKDMEAPKESFKNE